MNKDDKGQPQQGGQSNKPGQQGQQPGQNPGQQTQQPAKSLTRAPARADFDWTPPTRRGPLLAALKW
jgi:hypothetical protein